MSLERWSNLALCEKPCTVFDLISEQLAEKKKIMLSVFKMST